MELCKKTWRYMDLYRNGIIGKLAEYAAKKYRSIEYIFHKLNNMKLI